MVDNQSSPPRLLLATRNPGKVREIRKILESVLETKTLELLNAADYPDVEPPVEDGKTFEENALKKARHYAQATGVLTLADDSGLVVTALNGRPGVKSARYRPTMDECMARVLLELESKPDKTRDAQFVCVMALADPAGGYVQGRGEVNGRISTSTRGEGGFGYDPIFELTETKFAGKTVAEIPPEAKNAVSHRCRAIHAIARLIDRSLPTGRIIPLGLGDLSKPDGTSK